MNNDPHRARPHAERHTFERSLRQLMTVGLSIFFSNGAVAAGLATYQTQQASSGASLFDKQCASCHGKNQDDGQFAPPLRGSSFLQRWGGKSAASLFDVMSRTMPTDAPGSLTTAQYVDLLAFLLRQNKVAASEQALTIDRAQLRSVYLPMQALEANTNYISAVVPPNPDGVVANPLDRITPVTDAMLAQPPDSEWLSWRRTLTDQGFSPLKQIDRTNVSRLRLVWSWALANGPNEATPLEHDGVLFVSSHGDVVQALNAVTGDLLWQYARRLPENVKPSFKKALAIRGERLYVETSDVHVVALDVKTGQVVWDTPVLDPADAKPNSVVSLIGGPVMANGKVVVGTSGGSASGGNFIAALDADSGKLIWRMATIPRPGEPGGDSWNDLPHEKRSGASVWTPGSYDPDLNLVFIGVGQTYDTGPLRDRIKNSKSTNDALYTDTTLAVNPDTGKLVWYFQHLPNDQWDLDWAFERQIVDQSVQGRQRKLVITAGKPGIYDALDAASGKYAFSVDPGLQNFITSIDARTGAKIIDKTKVPGDGKTKFVCPHVQGAKSWMPGSYDPGAGVIVAPMMEYCMEMAPVAAGERGFLNGLRTGLMPRPDGDGRYGRLEVVDLKTRKARSLHRQRAPFTTGTLATAGGLIFAGSQDRVFGAFDADSGDRLWSVRLNDVPNSNAITYAVNGKQYVAVVSGSGGYVTTLFGGLIPEIINPAHRSSSIWVFELPMKD